VANLRDKIPLEREEKVGEIVRDTTIRVGKISLTPILKVPRQYPLVLLVEVMHMMRIILL
jgi:hypothetical protein